MRQSENTDTNHPAGRGTKFLIQLIRVISANEKYDSVRCFGHQLGWPRTLKTGNVLANVPVKVVSHHDSSYHVVHERSLPERCTIVIHYGLAHFNQQSGGAQVRAVIERDK